VKRAAELLRERRPDLAVEGPIQYDAAVDPDVAAVKVKGGSEVAGRANVCIFPDLNTGNNTYKVRAGRACRPLKSEYSTRHHCVYCAFRRLAGSTCALSRSLSKSLQQSRTSTCV